MNDPEVAAAVQQINELLAGYDKPIAFCAYSLDGSRAIAYNCRENYFSACTIKAGYMLYCCLAIDQGIVDPDEIMIYEKKYEHGGSGKIKNSEYGTPYTIKELIRLSLRYSDNIAYKMLVHYFGKDGYNKMMNELGVSKLRLSSSTSISSVWNYNTNARDLCIIWRELYFYFASETEMAKLFKTATTNTAYNYATKLIDEKYSHKSGDKFKPNPVYNDAAIVWKKDNPYVVATLNGSEGEEEDEYVVGTIVKLINDHIMK
jgi:beta-lactamase class A